MLSFGELIEGTRSRVGSWLSRSLPTMGVTTGIGITAWSIGATLGQLSAEAQAVGWAAAMTALSAELGKEFVVGLVERIRDEELTAEDVAQIVQAEMDKGQALSDVRRLLDEVGVLPSLVGEALRLQRAELVESLRADLAAYPQIVSTRTAETVRATLAPQLEALTQQVARLDDRSERILAALRAMAGQAPGETAAGVEPPLLVFVSSLIGEMSAERQSVRQAIASLSLTKPWVFESTPATAQPFEDSYLEKVRTCDLFVLLVDENVSSPVEKELETALQHDRPILAFLKSDRPDKTRSDDARVLIDRIPSKWATFSNATDLALKVRVALIDELIRRVRTGLVALPQARTEHLEHARNVLERAMGVLPARRYTHLVGREEEIGVVLARLRAAGPGAPAVVAITGLGGIGKTALAYEVAERATIEGLFDGLVWESAKLEEMETGTIRRLNAPALSYESLLGSIARQLDLDVLTQLPPRELEARLRTILRTKSYLIVVDNLETVEAYRSLAEKLHDLLSPGAPERPSRALLTSRERLVDIPYIFDYYIQGLARPASHDFLRREARDRRAAGLLNAGRKLLDDVYEITQGMPLAMKLVVSQHLLGIPVDTELGRLKGAKEEELYRFLYMRLWFRLSIPAQKVLVAAAAFAASVARFMLQPVSKTTDDEFTAAVPELVRMSLIEPTEHATEAQRRYSIHQMTRWFINAPLRELWKKQQARERSAQRKRSTRAHRV